MPLFYFHIWSNGELILDHEGSDIPTAEGARIEAIAGARCILSGDIKAGRIDFKQRVEVHDQDGRHLLSVPFGDAVTVIGTDDLAGLAAVGGHGVG